MKNLTFVIGKLSNGGAERVISILANKFVDKYNINIIVLSDKTVDYELNKDINLIFLTEEKNKQKNPFKVIKKFFKLRKVLKKLNSDIIVSFLGDVNIYTIISSFGIDSKLIVSERNYPKLSQYVPVTKYIFLVNKVLYNIPNKVIFQTDEIRKCFPKYIQRKGEIIPNPLSGYMPRINNKFRNKEIVTIARLTNQKNIPLLIDAFIEFRKIHNDYKLLIYGGGPLEPIYKKKYEEYIKSGDIEFCGFVKDVHLKISNSELFVLSSDVEGMPNALMEAMAMGLPCAATDSLGGGVRELSKEGRYVLLSPIKDKDALLRNMLYIVGNPIEADQMAQNASNFIRENYDVNIIGDKWKLLFDEIAK